MKEEMINKSNLQQALVAFEMSLSYTFLTQQWHYSITNHKPQKHF